MTKLNFEKIVSPREFMENIKEEDIETLKELSNSIALREKNRGVCKTSANFLSKKSREIPKVKYPTLSFIEKEYMSTTIMFSDNEKFIKCLLDLGITFEYLKNICSNMSAYKKLYSIDENDEIFKTKNYISAEKFIIKLSNYIGKYFKCEDFYLNANKLMYLVTFEKELYLNLQKQKVKKPQ